MKAKGVVGRTIIRAFFLITLLPEFSVVQGSFPISLFQCPHLVAHLFPPHLHLLLRQLSSPCTRGYSSFLTGLWGKRHVKLLACPPVASWPQLRIFFASYSLHPPISLDPHLWLLFSRKNKEIRHLLLSDRSLHSGQRSTLFTRHCSPCLRQLLSRRRLFTLQPPSHLS